MNNGFRKCISTYTFLLLVCFFMNCTTSSLDDRVVALRETSLASQISMFKKDQQLLNRYIQSIYDSIDTEGIRTLNIFTSNPVDYKESVLQSIAPPTDEQSLYGIPIVVKDNINTQAFPTTGGTPALADAIPADDAAIVQILSRAGAIVLGKTNLHELAFGITSNNAHFGAVKNPVNPSMFAGGSSGGTAAAIAAGLVVVGVGTDTGGSCRIPAALCGVYGYRPTTGSYDATGVLPLSNTRDTPGILASNLQDLILVDEAIRKTTNKETIDVTNLRIGIPRGYYYDNLSEGVNRNSKEFIQKLILKNIELIEMDIDGIPNLLSKSIDMVLHETSTQLPKYLETYTEISYDTLVAQIASPDVKGLFASGAVAQNDAYDAILEERNNLRQAFQFYFEQNEIDLILYPTTPVEARPIKGSEETIELNGTQVPTFPTYIRNMNPGSYAGLPSISIPVGHTTEGLPVGMTLEAPLGKDQWLLQVALRLENEVKY